jgi:hypothetical protein
MTGKDLKWDKMQKRLEEGDAIPELGLDAITKRRVSLGLPTPTEGSTIQERNFGKNHQNLPKISTKSRKFPTARKMTVPTIESDSDSLDPENINQAFDKAYTKKTTLAQEELRKEFNIAYNVMKENNKLPITIDPNCLNCMANGRDT